MDTTKKLRKLLIFNIIIIILFLILSRLSFHVNLNPVTIHIVLPLIYFVIFTLSIYFMVILFVLRIKRKIIKYLIFILLGISIIIPVECIFVSTIILSYKVPNNINYLRATPDAIEVGSTGNDILGGNQSLTFYKDEKMVGYISIAHSNEGGDAEVRQINDTLCFTGGQRGEYIGYDYSDLKDGIITESTQECGMLTGKEEVRYLKDGSYIDL